jgi:hypothetical protein
VLLESSDVSTFRHNVINGQWGRVMDSLEDMHIVDRDQLNVWSGINQLEVFSSTESNYNNLKPIDRNNCSIRLPRVGGFCIGISSTYGPIRCVARGPSHGMPLIATYYFRQ